MKRSLARLLTGSMLWLVSVVAVQGQTGIDPGVPDTLILDSTVAFVSGIGIVPVTFVNDEELSTIEVTLRHLTTQVNVDSFSFVGSRVLLDGASNLATIRSDSTVVTILSALSTDLVPAGSGLLGTLYYSYSNTITPELIPIDTFRWVEGPIERRTSFKGAALADPPFIPQFVPGYLDIQATPATLDSVWIAQVEAEPLEKVAVDVYAYNERALARLTLALDYGSSSLLFDSVGYLGTRGEIAPTRTYQHYLSAHKLYVVLEFSQTALLPGSGAVATLHFTVDGAAPQGYIEIDSTVVGIISDTRFTLTAADGGLTLVPRFIAGGVNVKASTDVEDITPEDQLPTEYNLAQNYPNPFNPTTYIELSLPVSGEVKLEVFNILGQKVRTLLDGEMPAGVHRVAFDGTDGRGRALSSGVYFYRVAAETFTDSKKMLLVK